MKVLITGGAGFIGSHIAAYHMKRGDEVVVVDNLSTGSLNNIITFMDKKNFTMHHEDLEHWEELPEVVRECDRVYHYAAFVGVFHVLKNPLSTLLGNINATKRLLFAVRVTSNKPTFIMASTSEVYGDQKGHLKETSPVLLEDVSKDQSTYSISKLCNESTALLYFREYDIPGIVLRIFNTIGQRQSPRYGMVMPRFVKQALKGDNLSIFGDGTQTRAFCDVRDHVHMVNKLAANPKAMGQIFNVGNDNLISIKELANQVNELCGNKSKLTYIPLEEAYHNQDVFIQHRQPDVSKALEYTGYRYQWTLKETLQDYINSVNN